MNAAILTTGTISTRSQRLEANPCSEKSTISAIKPWNTAPPGSADATTYFRVLPIMLAADY